MCFDRYCRLRLELELGHCRVYLRSLVVLQRPADCDNHAIAQYFDFNELWLDEVEVLATTSGLDPIIDCDRLV